MPRHTAIAARVNRPMRIAALALLGTLLAGCSSIDGFLRDVQSPLVRFEVWNTTLDAVRLTDGEGRDLEVAACGHAIAAEFRVDQVRVHTVVGYVWGFGSSGLDNTGRQYLVVVAADGESFPTAIQPLAIPPCVGHPNAQPGVFLEP
jgi:hypothetical protein